MSTGESRGTSPGASWRRALHLLRQPPARHLDVRAADVVGVLLDEEANIEVSGGWLPEEV
jgi:hypothetical protein